MDTILLERASWGKLFALYGAEPHGVECEELCAEPARVSGRIAMSTRLVTPGPVALSKAS